MAALADVLPVDGPAQNLAVIDTDVRRRQQVLAAVAAQLEQQGATVWVFTADAEMYAHLRNTHHVHRYTNVGPADAHDIRHAMRLSRVAVVVDGALKGTNTISQLMDMPAVTVVVGTTVSKVARGPRWAWVHTAAKGWVPQGTAKDYVHVATDVTPPPAQHSWWANWLGWW